MTLMTCVMVLRFYTRTVLRRTLGADDWIMGFAMMFGLAGSVLSCVLTRYGSGLHKWDVRPEDLSFVVRSSLIIGILLIPSLALTKISISTSYLRIFPPTPTHPSTSTHPSPLIPHSFHYTRPFAYLIVFYSIFYMIACTTALIYQCQPVAAFWRGDERHFECIDFRVALLVMGGLNSGTDFLVFLWPVRTLWGLRMGRRERRALVVLFAGGIL
ncbi:hypothetical protein K402DRAFT_348296 [Aulographum hederae CBS 113979]|uniref:Rhodopsin domain-containing protein n=1 Tax=Aulographum hederae CBS 113979 TaxID=1176131 RepID=A0A6G1HAW9_9PEZI|nr:hypothetical protein K402DRAFT_348296 [Aulographum hederae CBS 113979]